MDATKVVVALSVLGVIGLLAWWAVRRRKEREYGRPFPREWRTLLERSLPLYRRLPQDLRLALEPHVRRVLAEVEFVGCNGLEVTDEMRLVIALQACLLVCRHDPRAYASLYSVLVYPDEFLVVERDEDESGVVTEGERALSGQALDTARIVLSWRDVQESSSNGGAYHVVLHEFAHYLDHSVEGALTSPLSKVRELTEWHRILEREYERLCTESERGEDTLIDPYGAEEPAEFFAVATETFFGQSRELERLHPELYGALQRFYALDPARW
jgi:MtfA peptidase